MSARKHNRHSPQSAGHAQKPAKVPVAQPLDLGGSLGCASSSVLLFFVYGTINSGRNRQSVVKE